MMQQRLFKKNTTFPGPGAYNVRAVKSLRTGSPTPRLADNQADILILANVGHVPFLNFSHAEGVIHPGSHMIDYQPAKIENTLTYLAH